MNKISPKVFAHCSYIGTTGYNNHTRSFLRALSELIDLKARNFTVTNNFKGHNDTPHDVENYINSQDKKILSRQTYYSAKPGVEFEEHDIYTKFSNNFEHNVDLVFSEMDHHYY